MRDRIIFNRMTAWCFAAGALLLAGCGSPAAPAPPSLKLPAIVAGMAAERVGNTVLLRWTMPTETTDGLPLRAPLDTEVCRSVGSAPCVRLKTLKLMPGAEVKSTDDLPAALTAGDAELVGYKVRTLNAAHRTAGDSAPVYVASGAAPQPVVGLTVHAVEKGVLLHWQPLSTADMHGVTELLVRRELMDAPQQSRQRPQAQPQQTTPQASRDKHPVIAVPRAHATKAGLSLAQPASEPDVQLLRIPLAGAVNSGGKEPRADVGSALDATAQFGHAYSYSIQGVTKVALAGKQVEVRGILSGAVPIVLRDTFPPARPDGLAAVLAPLAADGSGQAAYGVDLSWRPGADPDLAGYIVYRREAEGAGAAVRVSPAGAPLAVPAFRDKTVVAGQRYLYSVSAVDEAGNESARSAEEMQNVPEAKP